MNTPYRLVVLSIVLMSTFVAAGCGVLESTPPEVTFSPEPSVLGRDPVLGVQIADAGGGVGSVRIVFVQGEVETLLVEESFESPDDQPRAYDVGSLIADRVNLQPGAATLVVTAIDGSYRANPVEVSREIEFDLYPPQLEMMSGLTYLNQGGSDTAVYRVGEDAVESGVRVGPHFFPGFPAPFTDDPRARFALFGFFYDLPVDTPVQIVARDAAGNEAVATMNTRVAARAFRSREIGLDDAFLQKVVPEIMSQTTAVRDQGNLIDTYVEINSELRRINHETIAELSRESGGTFLWDGGFLQLSNSQVESLFADRRTYMYNGEPVDQQDHVGFDLSVVERYPIEATNSGRVLLAEYFGIYGNTVLIDHGAGLISLYGHMSAIDVAEGDMVTKGQTLGRSGATGLAGGDHLHFGLFLHGVPVNPIEWWDAQWVEDHVLARLRPAG